MNNRSLKIVGGLSLAVLVLVVAGVVYIWVTGGSGEASREIDAPELDIAQGSESDQSVFRIVAQESRVQFKLQEDLNGNRIDVIGVTNQVAGDILVDFSSPQGSELGVIRINMRTLSTDNEFRNRAIRGQILLSERAENEFSDFVPMAIDGLPSAVTVGETFTFSVTGDFTIAGQTRPVTFDVTVLVESEDRISGQAVATVLHGDFGIRIPSVPSVANVSEEVELSLEFTAQRVETEPAEGA